MQRLHCKWVLNPRTGLKQVILFPLQLSLSLRKYLARDCGLRCQVASVKGFLRYIVHSHWLVSVSLIILYSSITFGGDSGMIVVLNEESSGRSGCGCHKVLSSFCNSATSCGFSGYGSDYSFSDVAQ